MKSHQFHRILDVLGGIVEFMNPYKVYLIQKQKYLQQEVRTYFGGVWASHVTRRPSWEGLGVAARFCRLLTLLLLLVTTLLLYEALRQFLIARYHTYQKSADLLGRIAEIPSQLINDNPTEFSETFTVESAQKDDLLGTNFNTTPDIQQQNQSSSNSDGANDHIKKSNGKYWFFKGGTIWPTRYNPKSKRRKPKIWPRENPGHDRIVDQLMFIPESYNPSKVKTILLPNCIKEWNVPMGAQVFQVCPVKACNLTSNVDLAGDVDVVMFRNTITLANVKRSAKQLWIIYVQNSAAQTLIRNLGDVNGGNAVNWTATYRQDSDIVVPYGKWMYYDESIRTLPENEAINFAANKTLKVAWFVSNCESANDRLEYVKILRKFIQVDVYGKCGTLKCPRFTYSGECFDLLNYNYKFYLSFESANCVDYITEKLFLNGLGQNVLPIVMGAPKDFYLRSAPNNSFIHVDDFASPQELAAYLDMLDQNDTLYNSYFRWKGTGEVIDTFFWCRLCTMIHDAARSGISGKYPDIEQWWYPGDNCREESWSDTGLGIFNTTR